MNVRPLAYQEAANPVGAHHPSEERSKTWARLAAGGVLLAGGALLLSGHRRAGLLAAAAGTAIAVLDQQETVRAWWQALPRYIGEAERIVNQAQRTVGEVSAQGERVRRILSRR